jgi:predicted porin
MKNKVQIIIAALSIAALVIVIATPASPLDFSISGQVNRAVLYGDDGESAKWFFVDNDNSSTRFRFRGSNDFENGWKVGFLWEVEMQSNASNKVSIENDEDTTDVHFDERHMDIWIEKWGTLRLGQGDTASNGTSEVDLSGTTVAAYSSVSDIGGNFEFRDGDKKLGITVSDSRSNFDGLSRKDRVRYDTPRWAGFFASGSVEQKNQWDLAARYAGDFGWARFAAAAGYANFGTSSDTKDDEVSSSASMLFDFGLSLTASYAYQWEDNKNPWNLFGKIGYNFLKKHAASVQYSRTKHKSADDDEGDTFGVGYVFNPWDSVELYSTYYLHMLDRDQGTNPDAINILMGGARIRF